MLTICRALHFRHFHLLTHHIDNIQELAEEVAERVGVVSAHAVDQIANDPILTCSTLILWHCDDATQTFGYHTHATFLPVFPYPMRDIKHHALKNVYVVETNEYVNDCYDKSLSSESINYDGIYYSLERRA